MPPKTSKAIARFLEVRIRDTEGAYGIKPPDSATAAKVLTVIPLH